MNDPARDPANHHLKLEIVPVADPLGPWRLRVENAGPSPVRLIADARLVTMDIAAPATEEAAAATAKKKLHGKAAKATKALVAHCRLPAEMRPVDEDDARALVAAPAGFDPGTARRSFRIALPDGVEFRLMPKLLGLLRREAPGIGLVTHPFDSRTYQADLDADRLDLAIGFVMTGPDHLRHRCLFRSGYVALFNPELTRLEAPITLADYTRLPHVVTSYGTDAVGAVDEALAASGTTARSSYERRAS